MRSIDRILLEAGAAAANFRSAPHRAAAAREIAQIDIEDLARGTPAKAHLAIALRESVIGMASMDCDTARGATAEGIRSLIKALRSAPTREPHTGESPQATPAPYWIDNDR